MKEIVIPAKTYKVYKFGELSEKIQGQLLNFRASHCCSLDIISKMMSNEKIGKNMVNFLKKECEQLVYLENGDIFTGIN